ncbi:hypothetical protein [Mariniphaga sp.]|uniref:hypothetical protein n=1 Tax=Mariniphaga sp. TaxID=1954475 RepID=UPI003563F706
MTPLGEDLQTAKNNIADFQDITIRVLEYLPNVLSGSKEKNNYIIYVSTNSGTTKYLRPINKKIFINSPTNFKDNFKAFQLVLAKVKTGKKTDKIEKDIIDSVLYTIQQSIGVGLDLTVHPNSARKHVGNRFEELVRCVFTEIGITNKRLVLKIPYTSDKSIKYYKSENDVVLSPYPKVKSTSKDLNPNEVVVSVKTTSKDRMGKMFLDKILLEKFVNHPQKIIGIFLNDVQRKDTDNISYTLVSGSFLVYTQFIGKLEGVYYLDPPPTATKAPYTNYMKQFSELITTDIKTLLTP